MLIARAIGYLTLLRLILHTYPRRAILGGTLMITQSFLYNATFFTYALVLTKFYHVSNNAVPLYGLAFAVVLGTVSQYVLRNAPCPVLTVPEADIDSPDLETALQHSTPQL